ncbi:MAG: Bax inhibitor-1/YccA family protein [Spirochaetota bacterium]|nr:Bax inhibitor-1/YccA family protein [Spirochaetota bacterium]
MKIDSISLSRVEIENRNFITKVYGWMGFALILTGGIAYVTAYTPAIRNFIFEIPYIFIGLLILEFILVAVLASWVQKMSVPIATLIFLAYSLLNGLTLSVIFLIYTKESLASTFFITAGTFGVMSAYGYFTKRDLTSIGNLAFMGLIGVIIASFINLFYFNTILYWITTYVGILVFVGLTAYDTQKIKNLNIIGNEGTDEDKKEAIMGALTLYLDFINLFLLLLRLFGGRKN